VAVRVVVAYDITRDTARARVAAVLSMWGDRLQRSVFACTLDSDELDALMTRLRGLVDLETDVVQVFRQCALCDDDRVDIGQAHAPMPDPYWIL
jgi:CRISPR-associated protein Cas2